LPNRVPVFAKAQEGNSIWNESSVRMIDSSCRLLRDIGASPKVKAARDKRAALITNRILPQALAPRTPRIDNNGTELPSLRSGGLGERFQHARLSESAGFPQWSWASGCCSQGCEGPIRVTEPGDQRKLSRGDLTYSPAHDRWRTVRDATQKSQKRVITERWFRSRDYPPDD
jgi:hypothetical protein